MIDPATAEFYATRAEEWAAHLRFEHSPELDAFLDRLPPGARILELGCGDGRDAAHMEARGFRVDATDGTPQMAELAARRLGRPAQVLLFEDLAAHDDYEAIWASSSLLHVPLADLPGILARIHAALRPGGWHWASYKGGQGGGRDEFGRFFSYVSRAQLEDAYRKAGEWSGLSLEEGMGGSFGGAPTPWLSVLGCRTNERRTPARAGEIARS